MLSIYLHWRGAFGDARFDLQGNAKAYRFGGTSDRIRLRAFLYVLVSGFRQQGSRLALLFTELE